MAKISIITPVFNSEKTLSETILSVKNQTLTDWEHIFVDDGSTDSSESIIKKYSQDDNRIKYYKREREPKGGSVCRNIGAHLAQGEYLMFLDSDDLLLKDCLKNRLDEIEENDLDFVVHPMASFYDDCQEWTAPELIFTKDPLYLFASSIPAWQVTSPLFKRSFFSSLNGFDESFLRLQDVEFHFRAICESRGHYKVFPSSVDCLYRLSVSGYNINKLKLTIPMYKQFLILVESKFEEVLSKNKKEFVLSQMLLYSNLSLILCSMKNKGFVVDENIYISDKLCKYMPFYVKWLPFFFAKNGGRIITRLQFYLAYLTSRCVKAYFIKH